MNITPATGSANDGARKHLLHLRGPLDKVAATPFLRRPFGKFFDDVASPGRRLVRSTGDVEEVHPGVFQPFEDDARFGEGESAFDD